MPPGYGQGQIPRELSEDPIEVDPKAPAKMADRTIVDLKKVGVSSHMFRRRVADLRATENAAGETALPGATFKVWRPRS